MNKITGNEPASAIAFGETPNQYTKGLTIRQQFAMAAMQGITSAMACRIDTSVENDVELACKYADALINELNKSEQ